MIMSNFALLEHINDDGHIEDPDMLNGFQEVLSKQSAKANKAAARIKPSAGRASVPAKGSGAGGSTGAGPSQNSHSVQPTAAYGVRARAEDYYRAFEHVYRDPRTGETILRFHKSNIVVIRPSGDVVLDTHGWFTLTTWSAMNDALQAIRIKVRYKGSVDDRCWAVIDDAGLQQPYYDGIVLPATKPTHKQRCAVVLKAYAGGAEVPVYAVLKSMPDAAPTSSLATGSGLARAALGTGNSPGSFAAAAGTAANFAVQQQQLAHLTLPTRTAAARSVPSKSVREQLQEAMQHLDMQDELQGDDDLLCVVCMHQERSQVLVPCGHMVLCSDCCAEILSKVGECPMCREKIVDHCTLQGMDLS